LLRESVEAKLGQLQADANAHALASRDAQAKHLDGFCQLLLGRMTENVTFQKSQFDTFAAGLGALTESNNKNLVQLREGVERKLSGLQADATQHQAAARDEHGKNAKALAEVLLARMTDGANQQKEQLEKFSVGIAGLTSSNEQKLEKMR
jgi:hypothetical protein